MVYPRCRENLTALSERARCTCARREVVVAVPHPGANVRPEEKIPVDLLPIAIQILAATVHKQVPTVRVVVATVVVIQRPVGGAGFRSGKAHTHAHEA